MKRGEIYLVDLGPGLGREASGVRPVVIVSNDVNNLASLYVTIVPAVDISADTAGLGVPVLASASGFPIDLSILAQQPRTLDSVRFPAQPVGIIPPALMAKISFQLKVHLDL